VLLLDGFHLPGLDDANIEISELAFGDEVVVRVPRLTPAVVARVAAALLDARAQHLAVMPIDLVVSTIDTVAGRFADPDDPLRRTAAAALPAITGFDPRMVGLILDRMAADWRAPGLHRLLDAELAGGVALDRFVAKSGGVRARAFGPRLAFHLFAGNVPGVAVTALVRSLLVRAAAFGKTASGEPLLAPLFARALAEAAPDLGACVAAVYWPGGERTLEAEAFAAADAVVIHGGRDAVADVRARAPVHVRLVDHGPRIAFGAVAREAIADDAAAAHAAAAAALAVATFDQQGCVSPHLIYVEEGGTIDAAAFAARLAHALAALEAELPRGSISPAEAAAIQQARTAAEFGAFAGRPAVVHAGPGTTYTVVFEPDPGFRASCLNRFVRVKPVARLEQLPELLAPYRAVLQSAGLAAPPERWDALAAALGASGVNRIASFETLPWPPPDGHHDGRGALSELVRWVDLEGQA
jgi:hypothetical protein